MERFVKTAVVWVSSSIALISKYYVAGQGKIKKKKNVHITTPFVLFLKCGYFIYEISYLGSTRGTSREQCNCVV